MKLPNKSVESAVRALIDQEGLLNCKIHVSDGCEKGINFVGIVHRVEIVGMNSSGKKVTKDLFCKTFNPEGTEGFNMRNLFLREIKMYNEIFTEMKKLTVKKKPKDKKPKDKKPKEEMKKHPLLSFFVDCLSTGNKEGEEFLILEDLTAKNFKMLSKDAEVDVAHATHVMEGLAKLHALSFALRDQNEDLFLRLSKELPELYYNENYSNSFQGYNDIFLVMAMQNLELEGKYKEKWDKFCENFDTLGAKCTKDASAEPYAVVCHGDMWNNNMMFKYDVEETKPTQVCFVDWQIARYCSPVLDVVHYLFGCTSKSFRKANYKMLITHYYGYLRWFIRKLGSCPDKLFNASVFSDHLKKFGKFGLIKAIVVHPLILYDLRNVTSITEFENLPAFFTDNPDTVRKLTAMWKDVVEDMVDYGYL